MKTRLISPVVFAAQAGLMTVANLLDHLHGSIAVLAIVARAGAGLPLGRPPTAAGVPVRAPRDAREQPHPRLVRRDLPTRLRRGANQKVRGAAGVPRRRTIRLDHREM